MMIFLAILGAFIVGLTTILYKKALVEGGNVSNGQFVLTSYFVSIPFYIIIYFLKFDFNEILNAGILVLILLIILGFSGTLRGNLRKKIYRNEKISILLPYENISKLLGIIGGYLIFRNVSIYSVLLGIISLIVIFCFTYDFKNKQLPKNFWVNE